MASDPATSTSARRKPDPAEIDRRARLRIPAQRPPKQPAEQRVRNWDEVFSLFDAETAKREATRCIQCPAAPCQRACPAHNDIPGALWLLERGDFDGAANVFRETNELPEMCGRLCPQERLCEGHCVVGKNALPVAIGKLETFATEWQRAHGGRLLPAPAPPTGKRVAVVGSGPAGIAVAERLALVGHAIVVFEAWPEPGGILLYGIPNFKQNKPAVARTFAELASLGVEVRCGVEVGRDVPWDELRRSFHAIFLGFGAPVGARVLIPNEDAPGVHLATPFLVRANLAPEQLGAHAQPPLPEVRRVVVIGGGDTSMDCVRTAVRLGAERVTCVYRRTEREMLGRAEERVHAREEGVNFAYLTTPARFLANDDGTVSEVELVRMELSAPDESGRRRPVPVQGSEYRVPATSVVIAIGYNADPDFAASAPIEVNQWHLVKVDQRTGQTNVPYIFAGGDVVNGADLVVTAIADGKRAATWLHTYLMSLGATNGRR